MGDTRLPVRELLLFQEIGASKHMLRMSCDDCRFEEQCQLVMPNTQKAHSGKSIMFTNVDLHNVQDHGKVHGVPRKPAGDQELAGHNLEKRAGDLRCRSPKRLRSRGRRLPDDPES